MIVVFGAGGQLGLELIDLAAREGRALCGFDARRVDITKSQMVVRAIAEQKPRVVINAAAFTEVDKAESEPERAFAVNAEGAGIVAAACSAAGVPLIQISTDYVFDGEKVGAYREDDPVSPLGIYGKSKASGEEAVRSACPHHLIIRTAWLYGIHGSNFLKTMLRLAGERDQIDVVADQTGTPTSTGDLAHAILVVAEAIIGGRRPWGTYHLTASGETTWHGFAKRIMAAQAPLTGRQPRVNAISTADYPTAARRPKNSVLDSSKFFRTFGYRAEEWSTAVDQTVRELVHMRVVS